MSRRAPVLLFLPGDKAQAPGLPQDGPLSGGFLPRIPSGKLQSQRLPSDVWRSCYHSRMSSRFISPIGLEKIAGGLRERAKIAQGEDDNLIDIEGIARTFGCEVSYVEFTPNDVSARVVRRSGSGNPASRFLIEVNAGDSEARRRYSIAHELAHVVLHDEPASDFEFVEYRRPLSSYEKPDDMYKEVQANMLAAALLMPSVQVSEYWRHESDIDGLARAFNVSRDSAYWRANNLGLLSSD